MNPVRVLVVDDSATMRGLISASLADDPGIEVIGQASDPLEAREAIKALNPDVMTLDVEMPKMDGLEFLEKVMRLRPFPVVMVSSLTARGATATIRAMELGAVDCIGKPSIDHPNSFDDLPARVRAAAGARMQRSGAGAAERGRRARRLQARRQDRRHRRFDRRRRGADLGDRRLSRELPADRRHRAYAEPVHAVVRAPPRRADRARKSPKPRTGRRSRSAASIWRRAPLTHLEVAGGAHPRCRLSSDDQVNGHRPSVDVLFEVDGQGLRLARGRRHPDRHGPRRRRRSVVDAARRRKHARPERGLERRLRNAQSRV